MYHASNLPGPSWAIGPGRLLFARGRPGGRATAREVPAMPNRRTMELVVITVLLMHPVVQMVHVWAAKHLATHGGESTLAEVVSAVT